jgi:RHS repeat-associated protein
VIRQVSNELGLLVAERSYHSTDPAGAYDESTFNYDRLDRLVTIIDPAGNTWAHEYDLAGRRVASTDPDTGTTTIVSDNSGQPTSVTDARGVTMAYAYDVLGRQTALHETSLAGPKLAEWIYDTVALGQLTSAVRFDDGLAYVSEITGYDDAYRPLGTKVTVPTSAANGQLAGEYLEEMTYRPDGSLATHQLPAAGGQPAETLTFSYTDSGLLFAAGGLEDYVAETTYRWDSTVAETLHGPAGKQVRQSWAYHDATGWLLTAQVDTEDQTNPGVFNERFATTYSYDPAGNVTSAAGSTDGAVDQVECFDYDYLRRLTRAWTQASVGCNTPQATGTDPYHRSWTFDTVGNRLTQTDHDPTLGDTTWTYHVGSASGVTAHQLAQVTATGPKAASPQRDFTYDLAGNMSTRTTDTGNTQTLNWDTEGRLASVTEGTGVTTYLYDADGNQLITRQPDKTTLHLGSIEIDEHASGALAGTRYYSDTAVRTATGLKWVATDRAGTASIQINADNLQPQRRRMMPYGEPRGTQPSWAGSKGYAGGTADDTGLTHLGARAYDPTIGRFISVDPILNLDDTAQWHGYSYANNSPLTWADPSGLMPICIDWCGSPADKSVREHQQKIRSGAPGSRNEQRDPDGRDGRRISNDERARRPEGGNGGGGHLDSDWAGRAILGRYLRGGGDWIIADDPHWSAYMMRNDRLQVQLMDRAIEQALAAFFEYVISGIADRGFAIIFHAVMENGESVVGYQYLHGTNMDVGGFQFKGATTITVRSNGTYEVTVVGSYTWNDIIDPNPQYSTDVWKSRVAEVATFGRAEAYNIHITWGSKTTVTLDSRGSVLSIRGYPSP